MYVKDLKDNMLVVPTPGLSFQFFAEQTDEGLKEAGVSGHLLVHKTKHIIPGYRDLGQNPAVYLFCRQDKFLYGGLYRHHYLLVGGVLCVMDGYQFNQVEPYDK